MTSNHCFLTKEEDRFSARVHALQKKLSLYGVQALVLDDPIDLYYYTGKTYSLGQLWICPEDIVLLVDSRYEECAKKGFVPVASLSVASAREFLQKNKVQILGFDGAKMSFEKVQALKKIQESLDLVNLNFATKTLRWIKDGEEIAHLQASAHLLWQGFCHVKDLLQEGVSEKELARAFHIFCLEKGAQGLSFEPIIAFGENSAMPHHRAGDRLLKKGDLVLIDIGVLLHHYHSDMTRVVFFGEQNLLLKKNCDCVLQAYDAAIALCKPGKKVKDLDKAVRAVFAENGVESYFTHSLGHGIGLQVHEPPKIRFEGQESDVTLEPGMVFTIEPGLYFPGIGGIRYEDTIVITDNGYLNLFPAQDRVFFKG